jgi:hypothetical protein
MFRNSDELCAHKFCHSRSYGRDDVVMIVPVARGVQQYTLREYLDPRVPFGPMVNVLTTILLVCFCTLCGLVQKNMISRHRNF